MWADSLITGPSRGDNRVNSKKTLSFAIAAVLTASGAGMANAQAPAAEPSLGLEEIVVTAQRRSENLQNVPISIQALTGETLKELKVSTLDEFVKYLPSVSTATLGPGQGNIYMRGLSVGALGTQGQGSVGQWPNVAVYLDEQSTQIPGRNLDVYAADLERIEVLEGPQGTLFGAGAQAGVLRYITAKPKYGVTEASASAGYDTTAHGSESSKLEAMLNLPLGDNLAARVVIYNDSRGGYIDNVESTFTRRGTDLGLCGRRGGKVDYLGNCTSPGTVPADSVAINNYNIAGKDINPVTYKGMRLGLNYKVNDDWNVLFQQTYQDMNASGVFYQMPNGSETQHLNPLEVTVFNNGITTDKFSNTALTVTGKAGVLDLTYAGAYLSRNSFQIQDYTNYARGVYGSYYQCTGYSGASVNKCYTPSAVWRDTTHNTNQSHEIRLATPTSWTLSGIGGVFWEQRKLDDNTEWQYKSVPECPDGNKGGTDCFLYLDASQSPKFENSSMNYKGRRNSNVGFVDDFQRTYTQRAIFGSLDWHIVDSLTLTVGTRYYHIENEMRGGNMGSFYCKSYGAPISGACNGTNSGYGEASGKSPYGTNIDNQVPNSATSSGFKSRVNLSWKPTADTLLYATWSQGYRPGGFNRGQAVHLPSTTPDANGKYTNNQWHVPAEYESDTLTNIEAGWKTSFMHNRIQWNGAIYQEDWKNVQTGIFAPQLGLGNLTVGLNGPDYQVRGIEMSLIARATEGLTLQGSMSYNKSELKRSPGLPCNIQDLPGYENSTACVKGEPIKTAWFNGPVTVENVFGKPGDPLANSPKVQANARARYEWTMNEYNYYWQLGAAYQSSSFSSATSVNRYEMPAWTQWDGSAGVAKGPWSAELVGSNLTDINKSIFTSAAQFVRAEVPQRPRTLGLRIGYKFKG